MKLIDAIDVRGGVHGRIELRQGDLTALAEDEAVDVLVVSAFPNNYVPTPESLIGALHARGLSVAEIARGKDIDLRPNYGCWLSDPFRTVDPGLRFDRIFGFEPLTRGNPPEVVSDIFRALGPVLKVRPEIRSIAMPIVAAGNQGYSVEEMLVPLLDAAIHWLEIGLPLDRLVIAAFTEEGAARAAAIFAAKKAAYTKPVVETGSAVEFDVFISYAHEDREVVDRLVAEIHELRPQVKIFLDRNELQVGAAWQMRIFESLARSRKVVAVLSPHYLASTVCKEEFSIAWIEGYQRGRMLLPVYALSADLPAYMRYLQYTDAREGDSSRLREAARQVLDALDGRGSNVEFASTSEPAAGGARPETSSLGTPVSAWAGTPAYAAIGRALERIVQIGSADPVIRDGLDAFAELAMGALAATAIRENPRNPGVGTPHEARAAGSRSSDVETDMESDRKPHEQATTGVQADGV